MGENKKNFNIEISTYQGIDRKSMEFSYNLDDSKDGFVFQSYMRDRSKTKNGQDNGGLDGTTNNGRDSK